MTEVATRSQAYERAQRIRMGMVSFAFTRRDIAEAWAARAWRHEDRARPSAVPGSGRARTTAASGYPPGRSSSGPATAGRPVGAGDAPAGHPNRPARPDPRRTTGGRGR